jgi:hypothetical protein
MCNAGETSTNLFAGNPAFAGKGSHVVAKRIPKGVKIGPGTQPNELLIQGSQNVQGNLFWV